MIIKCILRLVTLVFMSVLLACAAGSGDNTAAGGTDTVRGLIVEVNAGSLLELDSLTVEDSSGNRWRFEALGKRFAEFTPSHLREHMVLGRPVTVTFHRENSSLVLDDITD